MLISLSGFLRLSRLAKHHDHFAQRNYFGKGHYNRVVTGAESLVKLMALLYCRGKYPAIV